MTDMSTSVFLGVSEQILVVPVVLNGFPRLLSLFEPGILTKGHSINNQCVCVCLFPRWPFTVKHVQTTSILENPSGKEHFRKLPYDSLTFHCQIFDTSALFIK